MKNLLEHIYLCIDDFFFHRVCLSCGASHTTLCNRCASNIPTFRTHKDSITSLYSYHSPIIRAALRRLKYKNDTSLAKTLATLLYDALLEDLPDLHSFENMRTPILIPIPLHKKRKIQRGYNQSELLCKELSLIDTVSFIYTPDVLYRNTDTPSQTTLKNKKARIENVRGCFKVKNSHLIKGAHIIVIDDITTTGATIKEAMTTLKKAGAKKVSAYTIAH